MIFPFFIAAICVGVLLFAGIDAVHIKLPKGFLQCKQNDPEFNRCVLKAAKLAVPELTKGQPKFGIPPVDPLRIDSLFIDQGHGSVNIKLNFSNLDIIGLSTASLENVLIDPREPLIKVNLKTVQPVVLNGTYTISGKVLVLPIQGHGHSRLSLVVTRIMSATTQDQKIIAKFIRTRQDTASFFILEDGFTASAACHFKNIQKNDDTFWQLDHLDFNFNTTKLHILLENLFNGDKALGDNMNHFLNENWEILLDELRPAFRTALSTVFSQIIRRFFDRVPIAQVFPSQ